MTERRPARLSRTLTTLAAAALMAACAGSANEITAPPPAPPEETIVPPIQREMRGLWIATVANIDWPSRATLTADQQRAELVDIIQRASATGINTVIFQIRPAADAVYQSSLEPWASLLTGTQGNSPGYDPLALAIQEAHARGMELHAWINPFRAGNTRDTLRLSGSHLFHTRRDIVRVYGSNIWLDPGEPDVQEHSIRVVRDIVSRYDIDAIHADDYFYPYVQLGPNGSAIPFPDDATFSRYGGGLPRDDWRRANIDRFVERMHREVHAIKPTIKVGISPFGIWRPGFPPGVKGLDAFASIYADARKWLQEGWVDYLAPQLYWAISAPEQSFPALLDWWLGQNVKARHVWPGLAAYKVQNGTASAFSMQEIPEQIRVTRGRPGGTGHILYNTTWTLKQHGGALASLLSTDLYRTRSLVPASPWLDSAAPLAPGLSESGGTIQINLASGEPARWWTIQQRADGTWTTRIVFHDQRTITLSSGVDRVVVRAVDQAGNTSAAAEWRRP
ncbi:MAG TPA: family 10 glycosylhydrolase [Gemmatimonadaceae bacterium]|nr:family 10 glycosylhydrolase [Gemmatimonadaceae bacterium]